MHHEQRITCGAEDEVPADTHQEDSRILKTEQCFFGIVQMHCFLVVLRKNL